MICLLLLDPFNARRAAKRSCRFCYNCSSSGPAYVFRSQCSTPSDVICPSPSASCHALCPTPTSCHARNSAKRSCRLSIWSTTPFTSKYASATYDIYDIYVTYVIHCSTFGLTSNFWSSNRKWKCLAGTGNAQ